VRQLEHVLLNAWILCDEEEIDFEDLGIPGASRATSRSRSYQPVSQELPSTPPHESHDPSMALASTSGGRVPPLPSNRSEPSPEPSEASSAGDSQPPTASKRGPSSRDTYSSHRRSEKERIIDALKACNWNRVKAAELSGIPRRTFYRRLREYKIQ